MRLIKLQSNSVNKYDKVIIITDDESVEYKRGEVISKDHMSGDYIVIHSPENLDPLKRMKPGSKVLILKSVNRSSLYV